MQIALTGTPGTGKTTVAAILPYRVIDINALVKEGLNLGTDPKRGCLEADMDALAQLLKEMDTDAGELTILEGHFSHFFADWAIVLRLAPEVLRKRLEARGYSEEKVKENLEAEALDLILVESVENCSRVDEIDTTGRSPQEVAGLVIKIIKGELRLPPGQVDWLEDYLDSG
ncbi:MAG TPA: adenylate kinase family protein [Methanotrichaceae archaeon]|nr:adenylate kinase family protein [Methanotrichaceae archaeon]